VRQLLSLPLFVLQLYMTKRFLGVAYLTGEPVGSNARARLPMSQMLYALTATPPVSPD